MKTPMRAILLSWAICGTALADTGQALLDLATCHGSTLPAAALDGEGEGADRLAAMATVFADLNDSDRFLPSEYPAFWTPVGDVTAAGVSVQYVGTSGYGIFEGMNLVVSGRFDDVRAALSETASVDYDDCRADGLLNVCTSEVAPGQSRMIMSHPTDPAERTVLICVEGVSRDES